VLARVGAGVVALAAVVATAAPAFAATGKIDQFVPLPSGDLGVYFSALGLAPGQAIDPTSVTATIGGNAVPAKASFVSDNSAKLVRRTMLTIDLSGSMTQTIGTSRTTRIAAAIQAADAYLKDVPDDVQVGLVTFDDTARVVVRPTTDHRKVKAAVDGLTAKPDGNTALFQAVATANTALGVETAGTQLNQLIISDGKNQGAGGSAQAAKASIAKSGAQVDAVSIAPDPLGRAELEALTAAGKGSTVDAKDADQLTAIFASAAATQANQLLVSVTVPPELAGTSQTVAVTATADGESFTDSSLFPLPAAASGVPTAIAESFGPVPVASPTAGVTQQAWFLPLAVVAVLAGLFGLLAVAFLSSDRENQTSGRVRRRLSRYSLSSRPDEKVTTVPTSGALGQSQVARSAVELAGRVVQNRDLDTGLGARLEAAGLPLKSAEWMIIHLGIAIVAGLVMALLTGFSILPTLLGLALGLILPFMYLSLKESKRKTAFAQALPETLQLLSGSLAAGYSLPQAVDTVVRESSGPMAVELNKAIVEARLGVPIEDALDTVARRMDSVDFEWVVMAIRIQREVGGNLAEVLNNVAATMRERERLRRQVDVLSAEGRLSAVILGALPLLFVVYLILVRPEYIGVLVTNPLGIAMIVVGVILLIAGGFWLRKVVTVEV
jgi:tight adherence protein B